MQSVAVPGWLTLFKPRRDIKFKLLFVSIAMFILATTDISIVLRHNLEGFIYIPGPLLEDSEAYFDNMAYYLNVWQLVNYTCQAFIGDVFLVNFAASYLLQWH